MKLVTEGDSPPASPVATSILRLPETGQQTSVLYSDPVTMEATTQSTTLMTMSSPQSTSVVVEMSVLAKQEAELADEDQRLEDQLMQEAIERLSERLAYIR